MADLPPAEHDAGTRDSTLSDPEVEMQTLIANADQPSAEPDSVPDQPSAEPDSTSTQGLMEAEVHPSEKPMVIDHDDVPVQILPASQVVVEQVDSGEPPEQTGMEEEEEVVPEKLQDDEKKEPLYLTAFYTVLPMLRHVEDRRRVRANDLLFNKQYKYANNVVITSKYNIFTFVPRNLFEQFLRIANTYFLILLIIQLLPGVSSVPFYSTLIPLVGVLGTTAIKDAYDDIKRHYSDFRINNRAAHVFRDGQLQRDLKWKDVKVGDVIRLERDDFVTADMLVLSSSEPNSLVYIETAELDGETNLKVRQPVPETAALEDDPVKLSQFDGYIECEPPNNRLHRFVGTLTWMDHQYSIDNEKILLRGCRLRNTHWMYGVVIYAGHDTKLVQNSGKTKFKRTHLDQFMNKLVIFILGFLLVCIIAALIGSWIYEAVYAADFTVYVPYSDELQDSPAELAWLQVLSNIVVFNTFVPISLYVSVEIIRLGLSLFINWDRKMYYAELDIPAQARTTTLNEELGQIEYIFSDKTGTLTRNIMTFLKCTIRGVKYGEVAQEHEMEQVVSTGEQLERQVSTSADVPQVDFSWNPYATSDFVYYDQSFVDTLKNGTDPDCDEFFKLLCLCHTVLPSMETGSLTYNAQSPDEAALVSAARNFGYVFKARSPFTMTLDVLNLGREEQYEVLNILDFNNERKRMSVIVRHEDKITLYCKGADSIVFARLSEESHDLMKITLEHLEDYAHEGLRTLVLAKKDLSQEEYALWAEEYHEASITQVNRDEALDQVYEKIEQNLTLMGATAIEDKLQEGVPETIANLARANIKIWVLTGDKQETAVNIGYSSKLLTEEMRVFVVDEDTKQGVVRQIQEIGEEIDRGEQREEERKRQGESRKEGEQEEEEELGPPFGIVLNGHSLRYALKEDVKLTLLETAGRCQAVICCRVTPLQKKKVVDLVKKNKKAVTLAIGDGANDVGMIKAAHIGVGISGQEGQQAVLSSDFSFGQFRYLERLLLVHGRWSYHRMTTFLRYFFYKNFAFTFSQFLFGFMCGFTAQTLYDATYIAVYNVIYTSLPVIALAILDQDVDEDNCYRYPQLYVAGQQNKNFNIWIFSRSLIKGIWVAMVFFLVLFGLTFQNFYYEGYEWDYQSFGLAASGALTIIVNLQIALDTYYWNIVMHLFVWGSIASWFVVIPITSTALLYSSFFLYVGVANQVLSSGLFWFYWPVASVLALLPTIAFRTLTLDLHPRLVDDVRLKTSKEGRKLFKRKMFKRKTQKRHTIKRSSYAFAHQHGFANLIMSGLGFGMRREQVEKERRERLSTWIGSAPTSRGSTPSYTPAATASPLKATVSEAKTLEGDKSVQMMPLQDVKVDIHGSHSDSTPGQPQDNPPRGAMPGALPSPTEQHMEGEESTVM